MSTTSSAVGSHFLYPSALFASREPMVVSTILGSCVAVCLWDERRAVGGINHYMLPLWNGHGLASPKYGNIAMDRLFDRMRELGSRPSDLVAKVFGGGEVIEGGQRFRIGPRNIEFALARLKELGVPVVAKSTGGQQGRRIEFETHTGVVRQRYIQRTV